MLDTDLSHHPRINAWPPHIIPVDGTPTRCWCKFVTVSIPLFDGQIFIHDDDWDDAPLSLEYLREIWRVQRREWHDENGG